MNSGKLRKNEMTTHAEILLLVGARVAELLYLDLHECGLFIAGMFWGLWLFPLGYCVTAKGIQI